MMERKERWKGLFHRFWERVTQYYYLEELYYAFYLLFWLAQNMRVVDIDPLRYPVEIILMFAGMFIGLLGIVVFFRHLIKRELGSHLLCVQVWKTYAHSPGMRIAVVLATVFFLYSSRISELYPGSPRSWTFVLGGAFATLFFHRSVDIVTLENAIRQILLGQKVSLPVRTSGAVKEDLSTMETLFAQREATLRAGIRAEKLKTQLITNVSHDLKTPLTSIINYADLLKDDNATVEEKLEYLEILSRNAQRMKSLINDIVFASRTDTGNVETVQETLELNELLLQCYSLVDNHFEKRALEFIFKPDREEILVCADGGHLSRVVDNLLVNISKYAMEGTRVYAYTSVEGKRAKIVLKNTSRDALDVPVEELMERFVRGDRSRHSEGSGLGLSIADSLIKLLGGELTLDIDADLFTATVTIPLAGASAGEQPMSATTEVKEDDVEKSEEPGETDTPKDLPKEFY